MSEKRYKRFYVSESENQLTIYDNDGLDDYYHLGNDERDVKGICKLLNEQQDTISALKEENEDFRQRIKELQRSRDYWIQDNNRLTKRNNELIAKIDFLERVIDEDINE